MNVILILLSCFVWSTVSVATWNNVTGIHTELIKGMNLLSKKMDKIISNGKTTFYGNIYKFISPQSSSNTKGSSENILHAKVNRLLKEVATVNTRVEKLLTVPALPVFDNSCLSIRRRNRLKKMSNGVYSIYPYGNNKKIHVYCDMNTDGGGWTLISKVTGNAYNKVTLPNPLTAWSSGKPNYFLKASALARLHNLLHFAQIRFKCSKPTSRKSVDLATSTNGLGAEVVKFFTGKMPKGKFPKACGSFVILPEDHSVLSKKCSQWGYIAGKGYKTGTWGHDNRDKEIRMMNHLFFVKAKAHFQVIQGRWECDDNNPGTPKDDDYWKIYVR